MSSIYPEKPQLHMVWPANRPECPSAHLPTGGYCIRTFRSGDEKRFLALMALSDFDPWDEAKLSYNMNRIIPEGWFFVEDAAGQVVATAMCLHNYSGRSPFTGDVGWVFCHPDHRGCGLGRYLCARVTRRFLEAGYTAIQLHTEYYRLAAIQTYLKLGYVPLIESAEVAALWQEVSTQLGWPSSTSPQT